MSQAFSFSDVWSLVCRIPEGKVATYGQVAKLLGRPRAAQLVGYAMARAPEGIPCHRVVNRTGGLSDGFSPFGRETHRLLLLREDVPFLSDGNVDLSKCLWKPAAE